jgi:histidyl-tRNA synthetase
VATFQSLPGFREFYPGDCAARNGLFEAWRASARRFGFAEYDAPILEPLELFTEKSGEEIRAQLFEFEDKGGRKVALRPEMTPSLARLVAAQAGSLRKPVKWFNIGECFRYEKPQKGRGREFYQFNADILGEPGVGADAECIALLVESLKACGLKEGEFEVRISDRKLWFLFMHMVGVGDGQMLAALAIVDKWERESETEVRKKLSELGVIFSPEDVYSTIKNFLKATREADFVKLGKSFKDPDWEKRVLELEALFTAITALNVKNCVRLDLSIVRGLAYYTGFVFEAFQTVGTARALAGGGRYDDLLNKLCGVEMPAVGFAIGDMTVTDLLQELKRPLGEVNQPAIYVVIGGEAQRPAALKLVGELRAAGLAVDYPLKDEKFGKQFKAADQCGAKLAVILGTDEAAKGEVKIKDMRSGVESSLANDGQLVGLLRAQLAGS